MIEFNSHDFNLNKIRIESKLGNLITKYPYRIYGAKQGGNNPVEIYYNSSLFNLRHLEAIRIVLLFNRIGFIYGTEENDNKIFIGLRKDLRKNVLFSSALLQTIIYTLEGRLHLDIRTKLPKHPKFES